jgi:predicted helicase
MQLGRHSGGAAFVESEGAMATFPELVSRLSRDRHEKGREFERICRWYLRHDPLWQFDKVWLWKDWPGRWGADAGIDLVAQTHSGALWAVQAKAYAPNASITKADLDTFLSESSRPEFAARLLVSTTDHLSHNAHRTVEAQEKPVRVVTPSELAKAALDWPKHPDDLRARPLPKKSPRSHQRAALEDVLRGFRGHERGQLVMACGTGKTMVSLWAWEALNASTALVVVPSLSLLAQTLREWRANRRVDFEFLVVCSDESVTEPDLVVRRPSELPFATTTDATEIAAFLEQKADCRRVLFSTYQSTPRVAEALADAGKTIDLAIADEAHRCAGRVDGGFSTVLKDEQIPCRCRLFMTATPRYLSRRVVKAAQAVDVEVVSMDDEAVFGPVFHALTFGEAIAQGLLTDYQVAIVGVEESRCQEMAERATFVRQRDGKVTDARTLAAQVALLRGMSKYDLRRCVTFHSRVAHARQFADSLDDVTTLLPVGERGSCGRT